MGRKIYWTDKRKEKAFNFIIDEMCTGKSLASIINGHDRKIVPAFSVFLEWCAENATFANSYTHAIAVRADYYFERINDIAATPIQGEIVEEVKEGRKVIRKTVKKTDNVARSKLMTDNLQWTIARMNCKKYGNTTKHTGGDGEAPVTMIVSVTSEEAREISKNLQSNV